MSKSPRDCKPDSTYEVSSTCYNNMPLFEEVLFREAFFEAIEKTNDYYNFILSEILIKNNSFQLIIKTLKNEANLSEIIRYLKARASEKYNRDSGRIGTNWNGKFKSKIIDYNKDSVFLKTNHFDIPEFSAPENNKISA